MSTKDWQVARTSVQERIETLMSERMAARFLYRGKLWRGAYKGQYVGALLYSVSGCRYLMQLFDALAEGKAVPVTLVTSDRKPLQATLLVLKRRRLCRVSQF